MANDIIQVMKKDVVLQIRLTAEAKKALDTLAEEKNTSVTRLLEHALVKQYPELIAVLPSL